MLFFYLQSFKAGYKISCNGNDVKDNILEPELEWIVYVCRHEGVKPYLTACRSDVWESVKETNGAKTILFRGSEDECDRWYTSREHLIDVIAAWEDGKTIQYLEDSTGNWIVAGTPLWSPDTQYRIKPELKWTDLKIGDIIQNERSTHYYMVIGIDMREDSKTHIYNGVCWLDNDDLEYWKKVE